MIRTAHPGPFTEVDRTAPLETEGALHRIHPKRPAGCARGRQRPRTTASLLAAALVVLSAAPPLGAGEATLPPELRATVAVADYGMVATGSPEATMAGVEILERGGNAVDAAVAAALALGVADPDASGLGGMTYMLIRLADGRTVAIDGTARAPASLDLERFRSAAEAGRDYGHEMVAVPTTLAVLDTAIRTLGTLSMAEAMAPAIRSAESGYRISPVQITWTGKYHEDLLAASDYLPFLLMEDGRTIGEPGRLVCNHDLAGTLRLIAREGVGSFYRGAIADRIEADMKRNGGHLRKHDLAMLRVKLVPPATTTYRGLEVLTVPEPAGGQTLVELLDILETFPPSFLAEDSLARYHVFVESVRIAFSGRASVLAGVAGSGFPASPRQRKEQARILAQTIVPGEALPTSRLSGPVDPACLPVGESTTHVSVMDQDGNVVSLTQTLGQSFGAKVATPGLGFIYNNHLSSFKADKPECPGFLHPGSPCPNDMAPTILVDPGGRVMALGSPGSNRIPSIIAGIISHLVDRGMGLREAIEAPRVLWGGGKEINVEIEVAGPLTEAYVDAFNAMSYDHPVEVGRFPGDPAELVNFGGVNAVAFEPTTGSFIGVVDPRRGGLALGPQAVGAAAGESTMWRPWR